MYKINKKRYPCWNHKFDPWQLMTYRPWEKENWNEFSEAFFGNHTIPLEMNI